MIKKLLCANRLDGQKYIPNNLNVCNANIFLGNRAKRNSLINCFKSIRLCEVNNNRNRCRSGCAALCSQTAQMNWIKAIFIVIEFIPFHFYRERERHTFDCLFYASVVSLSLCSFFPRSFYVFVSVAVTNLWAAKNFTQTIYAVFVGNVEYSYRKHNE